MNGNCVQNHACGNPSEMHKCKLMYIASSHIDAILGHKDIVCASKKIHFAIKVNGENVD